MSAVLSTARLVMRPYVPDDAPALFAFMRDAVAMQHTYVAPNLAHCQARLAAYEAMRPTLGFGPWTVASLETGHIVGWGGLSVDPQEPQWGLEVIYAFAPSAWGRGYATELVLAALATAFGALSVAEVHAYARPQNAASLHVLHKCGFRLLRFEPLLERQHLVATAAGSASAQ